MTATDDYLHRVSRAMAGMDRRARDDVLRELKAHLADAVADGGESSALSGLEPPEVVAKRYKEVYGYGKPFQALFILASAGLAVLTVPLFGLTEPEASIVSTIVLVALVAYLLAAAVRAGSTVGFLAGLAACVVRIVSLAGSQLSAPIAPVTDVRGWTLFLAVSALLVVLGYLPGRAKEKWTRRDVSM